MYAIHSDTEKKLRIKPKKLLQNDQKVKICEI